MTDQKVHVADVGTVIELTIVDNDEDVVNVSSATVMEFLFSCGNVTVQKDAEFTTDGSDGKLSYKILVADDFTAGRWNVQARVEMPAGIWYSSVEAFEVEGNLVGWA
jgi:hypothetical protein